MADDKAAAPAGGIVAPQPRPRVHGNGFLQLDLSPTTRLHVFGAEGVPKQAVDTPLHDHTFSFTSRVLFGAIHNTVFEFVDDPDGVFAVHVARVRDREDTVLEDTGQRWRRVRAVTQTYKAGESYRMERGIFHETAVTGLTITVIEKDGPSLAQGGPSPRVLVPVGRTPDNEFNRYSLDASIAWDIIVRSLLAALADRPARPQQEECPHCGGVIGGEHRGDCEYEKFSARPHQEDNRVMKTRLTPEELQARYVAIAEALREWIDAQPIVMDEHGNPTISPVYGAHVLLCDLIESEANHSAARLALRSRLQQLRAEWRDEARIYREAAKDQLREYDSAGAHTNSRRADDCDRHVDALDQALAEPPKGEV